ncbi:MAG: carbamoyltransferase HypF [Chitinophagaceae bacterium]
MNTWYIHIGGLVQGVGFRPFVYRTAEAMKICGWVSNGNDGVHIKFNSNKEEASRFYTLLISKPPANAIITSHICTTCTPETFSRFIIKESDPSAKPDLLLAPDIAICKSCLSEIKEPGNNRFQYPFITCLECGPRYSIITHLPYDRKNTTMKNLKMCDSCSSEYNDHTDRRHYSQTNSCPDCCIPMHLYDDQGVEISHDPESILLLVQNSLEDGHIVAIKGIGGYLLLCDATKHRSIKTLRDRKYRPAKPFAVMYPSIQMMETDLVLTAKEKEALAGKVAPIVLCKLKKELTSGLCVTAIAPGLDKLGVLLPYTGLLVQIAERWNKPLIATSGNLSGSPIIYTDDDAILWLGDQADFIVSFDRDIVAPQDDSVILFTEKYQQRVILRRSRGLAPNYFPNPFQNTQNLLAMGAEMKSAFAILDNNNLYISQFLGDQGNYDSQLSYKNTLLHLGNLLKFKPDKILIDSHPNYHVSLAGIELGEKWNIPVTAIQHHKAHFCAVLAENHLLEEEEPILGVVWDGTGYGEDDQVWGGEFFLLKDGEIDRYMHLEYFPQLLGDKMSKEPRVSAVSLLRNNMDHLMMIRDQFSIEEREFYLKVLQQQQPLLTSSAGRLLDGISSILNLQSFNTYEGEAAMKLEAAARKCETISLAYYPIPINKNRLEWSAMIEALMIDKKNNVETPVMARKVFVSLAMLIRNVAVRSGAKKIAFSGGVFQNSYLLDLIRDLLQDDFQLYFHQQLSPNDECIGFGQIAYTQLMEQESKEQHKQIVMTNH